MKTEIIRLHEKASQLLELANAMDKRIGVLESNINRLKHFPSIIERNKREFDTCQRGSIRLWSAYKMVLLKIVEL